MHFGAFIQISGNICSQRLYTNTERRFIPNNLKPETNPDVSQKVNG